MTGVCIWRKLR